MATVKLYGRELAEIDAAYGFDCFALLIPGQRLQYLNPRANRIEIARMDDAFGVSMQGAEQRGREAARGAEAGTGRYIGKPTRAILRAGR